jgi:NAD(P)-dependent dehydrogenase (short-subunit alcohol dehydrogenase family)
MNADPLPSRQAAGRVWLITGGPPGLGRAIAEAALAAGTRWRPPSARPQRWTARPRRTRVAQRLWNWTSLTAQASLLR